MFEEQLPVIEQKEEESKIVVECINQIWNNLNSAPSKQKNPQNLKKDAARQQAIDQAFLKDFSEIIKKVSDAFGGVQKTASDSDLKLIRCKTSKL